MAEANYLVEKYMADEMSDDERNDFEDHMFACPVCSEQVRQDFTITENLKVLPARKVLVAENKAGWRQWLRMHSLVPTFAALALACIAGYEHMGRQALEMAVVLPQPTELQPVMKGADGVAVVHVDRSFPVFNLSVNADTLSAGSFLCDIQNAAGKKILSLTTGQQNTAFDLQLRLPEKEFPAGQYRLLLRPVSEPDSIVTYPFSVEDKR